MKILAGRSNKLLAKYLAVELNIKYIEAQITIFDDSEINIQISENLREDLYGEEVVIVQSTCRPVNDHLMELLLLIDAASRGGASQIILVIPYFGYSRQDRPIYGSPISASVVANCLQQAGADHLITIDLHSPQIADFFNIPVQNLETFCLFAPILSGYNNFIIVSPDAGSIIRSQTAQKQFNSEIAIINKVRDSANNCQSTKILGNVTGKHCILIDDIIDSGQTICQAAKLLMSQGALSVDAFISHAVLSLNAANFIEKSDIDHIYITDTIKTALLPTKFSVISVAPIILKALRRML